MGCILLMEFQSFVIENLRALTSKKGTPLKGMTGQMVSYCATLSSFKIITKRSGVTSCSICGVINWKFPSPVFYEY